LPLTGLYARLQSAAAHVTADIITHMAAAPDHCLPEVVDLTRLNVEDLEPLLEEERVSWRSALSWDFTPSLDLVRRFVRIRALSGYALRVGKRVIGYAYYVVEDRKGLIGDLYVARDFETTAHTDQLLAAILSALIRTPGVERIEGQLMLAHGPVERAAPFASHAEVFSRVFMLADLDELQALPAVRSAADEYRFTDWDPAKQDDAAMVIASAYQGHVDGKINDQYRTWLGSRRFLGNVTQYPGCGQFFGAASKLALDGNDKVCGVLLASAVAGDTGHVTQVCVSPETRGKGLGYELIRRAMATMREHECDKTSLTVTASNTSAVQLYQRMGFRAKRRFGAYVWEGF
jgi:ribosomal protein S18 acetylase RimI-like enzyme